MVENKEIKALFHLIDDPDEEVYTSVSDRIISFGKGIIPNLENLWENTLDEDLQERIELLIHKLHFRDLADDFKNWKTGSAELLQGAMLTAQYHYPEIQSTQTLQEIEKLRRNLWLELNNYQTPLEQTTVLSSILYNYSKQKGVETLYDNPDEFLINKTLESKKGNAISNGIIYLILCELLDIPIKAINIPNQFILAYFDPMYEFMNPVKHPHDKIVFFIDPLNGQIYTHHDVENYFKRISAPLEPAYFRQMNNVQVIQYLLNELSKCFNNPLNLYKMNELIALVNLIGE